MKTLALAGLVAGLAFGINAQSQFQYTINADNTVTITGYTGTNGILDVPSNFNGLAVTAIGTGAFNELDLNNVTIPYGVTSIGPSAFYYCFYLTNIVIPSSVTSIGQYAFFATGLTSVTIPRGVTSIEFESFYACTHLTNLVISDGVMNIGENAFTQCSVLTNLTIPASVSSISDGAFSGCASLTGVFFMGNPPNADSSVFGGDNNPVIYYLSGTIGWSSPFASRQALLWNAAIDGSSLSVQSNQFGFNITGTPYIPVIVEACTNLTSPVWTPILSATLTNGSIYFGEPQQPAISEHYYRLTPP